MFCALRNLIFFYRFYYFLGHIDKMPANVKFRTPAIITPRELIVARYGAILDQSERAHLNHQAINAFYFFFSGFE